MLGQATSRGEVLRGVQEHGLAPGARRMIDWEEEAADEAMRTGGKTITSQHPAGRPVLRALCQATAQCCTLLWPLAGIYGVYRSSKQQVRTKCILTHNKYFDGSSYDR